MDGTREANGSAGTPATTDYDVVVIGAGPVGENAAEYAAAGGLRVAMVEAERVGGECSYWACMPSKALLRPLDVAAAAEHLGGLGGAAVLPDGLLARRDEWRSHLDDSGQVAWAESVGVDVVRGRGRLVGERRVAVSGSGGERELRARHAVVLATGSVPVVPDALAAAAPWTSRDATGVFEAPGRLAVVGGGVVAVEAATWLAALGSAVTVLVRGDRLLGDSEPFVSDAVAQGLRARGVHVRFGVSVEAAERPDVAAEPAVGRPHGGRVTLTIDGREETFDELLVATGRRPATDALGLEVAGLGADDLDGRLQPGPDWLYTVGDVSGGPKLTHWGKYAARIAGELIAGRAAGREASTPELTAPVPQVVFTDPQVAQVGLTEAAASDRGLRVRTVDQPVTAAAGFGLLRDDATGTARLVIEGDRVVGATFVGPEVAELLHAATIAITARTPLDVLRHAVPAYPTASEIWLRLVEAARRGDQAAG